MYKKFINKQEYFSYKNLFTKMKIKNKYHKEKYKKRK